MMELLRVIKKINVVRGAEHGSRKSRSRRARPRADQLIDYFAAMLRLND